ncbi:MAG: hypothetical protein P4L63_01125 [Candidatus Pacebacteria bacterium]|nr:hypothetical protein [Candidatus Paceibacterota bacterium]
MKNYPNKNKSLFLFVFVLIGLLFVANKASALTLSPSRLEISGDPGQTLTEKMVLINENNDTETFYSSYANFQAQGESGDPAFVTATNDLGTWMSTQPSITLSPGESQTIPFTINIPKNAEPGGHFAVVFWGTASPQLGTVGVGSKTGLLVLLSVNGDVKQSAGFLSFNTVGNKFWYSTLPVSFEYRFKNDGGDRIKPVGPLTIRDTVFFPAQVLDANPGTGNVLPGSTRRFQVDWINYVRPVDYVTPTSFFPRFWSNVSYQWKNFAIGLYSANLNVAYSTNNQHAKATVFFFVFPWQLILVMLVVIAILFWGGKFTLKRYNKFIIEKARQQLTK